MVRMALVGAALLLAQEARRFEVTPDAVACLAAEAVPLVEAVTNRRFRNPPAVRIATREEVVAALEKEILPQLEKLHPGIPPAERRLHALLAARAASKSMYGKFAVNPPEVLIIAENFPSLPRAFKARYWASPAPLKLILVHELVHALDHQLYPILGDPAPFRNAEELGTLNALIEGHAQQVTAEAARRAGLEAVFVDLEAALLELPPNLEPGERLMATIRVASHRFAYRDGRRFFEELLRAGPPDVVDRVFRSPPKTKDVILYPARFLDPRVGPGRGRDLDVLLAGLVGEFGSGWRVDSGRLNAQDLRARFADLLPEAGVDEALEPYQQGLLVRFESSADPRIEFEIWLHETASVEAGGRLYERLIEADKAALALLRVEESGVSVTWDALREARYSRNTTITVRCEEPDGARVIQRSWIHVGRAVAELSFDGLDLPLRAWVHVHDIVTEFLSRPFIPGE